MLGAPAAIGERVPVHLPGLMHHLIGPHIPVKQEPSSSQITIVDTEAWRHANIAQLLKGGTRTHTPNSRVELPPDLGQGLPPWAGRSPPLPGLTFKTFLISDPQTLQAHSYLRALAVFQNILPLTLHVSALSGHP